MHFGEALRERKRKRGRGRRRGGEEYEGKVKGKGRIRVEPQIPVIGMQHTKKETSTQKTRSKHVEPLTNKSQQ
jgi:hypothetical protein